MKSDRRKKEREAKKAKAKAAMSHPGGSSVYARKLRGDLPPNSPYRDRWEECRPFGAR